MLSVLVELFLLIIFSLPLSSNLMNIFKDSLFSSSKSSTKKKSSRNQFKNYQFRQANSSFINPLLYTFPNEDIELGTIDSDEETNSNNEHSVRTRYSAPAADSGGSIVIVEKSVLPNETIQAFAIRYRVSVSQLKRLNNIQNDQDFYALAYCRVPVRRFGLLHETSSTLVDLNEPLTTSLPVTHLSQQNHHAFLNAMDQDLATMRTKVEQLIETPSTTLFSDQLISQSSINSMIKPVINKTSELNCDGTDCGFKLWHIVLIIILIALIPIIYAYFYIKSRHNN